MRFYGITKLSELTEFFMRRQAIELHPQLRSQTQLDSEGRADMADEKQCVFSKRLSTVCGQGPSAAARRSSPGRDAPCSPSLRMTDFLKWLTPHRRTERDDNPKTPPLVGHVPGGGNLLHRRTECDGYQKGRTENGSGQQGRLSSTLQN